MATLTLDSSQIVPFAGIVLSIFLYAFRRPNYVPGQELFILPWLIQIMMGYTWLNYAFFRKDLFVYLQIIPALVTAVVYTLQWHPYLRKKSRRAHETIIAVGLTLIVLTTLGTSVSPYLEDRIARIGLGTLAGVTVLAQVASMLRETVRSVFSDQIPTAMEFAVAGLAFLNAGCWTAYGFYGASDPFIYVPNIVWAAHALITLAFLAYGAFRAGGLDMGFDSASEAGDDDMTVDRLNRMSSVRGSSYAGSVRDGVSNRSQRSFRNPYHDEPEMGTVVVSEAKYASEDELEAPQAAAMK
ncbi:hypothetical protein HDU96_003488 [Phlyctochytrium bullatum]|nr:hypothetical protein HDU96_003488 [Phlyctochytrium bullatum]